MTVESGSRAVTSGVRFPVAELEEEAHLCACFSSLADFLHGNQ